MTSANMQKTSLKIDNDAVVYGKQDGRLKYAGSATISDGNVTHLNDF